MPCLPVPFRRAINRIPGAGSTTWLKELEAARAASHCLRTLSSPTLFGTYEKSSFDRPDGLRDDVDGIALADVELNLTLTVAHSATRSILVDPSAPTHGIHHVRSRYQIVALNLAA